MVKPDPQKRYRDFVASTMKTRIPAILRTAEEGFDAAIVAQLRAIGRAVEAGAPMVMDLDGWPFIGWEDMPARVNGRRIGEAPFFDFEYWLYFRILAAVRFAETRADPFRHTKHRDLDKHLAWADDALGRTNSLADGLRLSLAANTHDLSQVAAPGSTHEFGAALLDLDGAPYRRLNLIADNFGGEFVADLVLAIVAAEQGIEAIVHVKQLPMFVSDVTSDDVTILLDRVGAHSDFGQRLAAAVRVGTIRFASSSFWSSPKFFDRLPEAELNSGDGTLTVLKGDLNFRRAVGDVSLPIETPFAELPVQPPAPMLSLRSIKSYCVAGITDWPAGVSRTDFPMDGSIVAVQQIPAKAAVMPSPPSEPVALPRLQRWLRRGT
jgi:hypothetical protein